MTDYVCKDCGNKPSCPQLLDQVWLSVAESDELLCIDCFEKRLGSGIKFNYLEKCGLTLIIKAMIERDRKGLLE